MHPTSKVLDCNSRIRRHSFPSNYPPSFPHTSYLPTSPILNLLPHPWKSRPGRKEGRKKAICARRAREREGEKGSSIIPGDLISSTIDLNAPIPPIDPSGQIYYRREGIRPLFHQDSNATRSFRLMERI